MGFRFYNLAQRFGMHFLLAGSASAFEGDCKPANHFRTLGYAIEFHSSSGARGAGVRLWRNWQIFEEIGAGAAIRSGLPEWGEMKGASLERSLSRAT
jgi:hypothetical protein